MRKILLLFSLLVSSFAFGQTNDDATGVNFYGVDFSLVKIRNASETPTEFKKMFYDLNFLFISEPKKFNVAKYLNKSLNKMSLEAVNQVNRNINEKDMTTQRESNEIDPKVMAEHIKSLPIKDDKGIGVVMVAKLLDKTSNRGYYQLVYFDIETRELLSSFPLDGKSQGFGLRNFWAATVYKSLKSIK